MSDEEKKPQYCTNCGSGNVMQDAWVHFNTQELANTFDDFYCESCEQNTSLDYERRYAIDAAPSLCKAVKCHLIHPHPAGSCAAKVARHKCVHYWED